MPSSGSGKFPATAADNAALLLERLLMTARLTPSAAMANIIGAVLVAGVLSADDAAMVPALFSWAAVMVFVSVLRVQSTWPWHPRHGAAVPQPTDRDLRSYIVATTLTGCCWGIAILCFVPLGDERALTFLTTIILGYAVGSVPSSMPVARASQGYLLGTLVPLAVRLALEADAMAYGQAALLLMFGAVLVSYQRSGYASFVVAIAAKLRNERLAGELAATQARLLDAIENTSEGFALYDSDTRLVLCNDNYRRFFDLPPELVVPGTSAEDVALASLPATPTGAGRAVLEAWIGRPASAVDDWVEERVARIREGSGQHFEQRLSNGGWIRSCYRRTHDGGTVVQHVDISALKLREMALQRAEAEYRSLFDNTVVGVYRTLPDGTLIRANRALAELHGYSDEAGLLAASANVGGWYLDDGRREEFIGRLRRDGRITEFVSEAKRRRDGESIWISENAWVVTASNGAPVYYEGTVLEVTGRKLAEEALARARAAEEASRLKSEFLANMSHELRTPLNAVIGFSEAMLAGLGGALEDRARGYVQDINRSGQHLLQHINDILDISKIEAGALDLEEEAIDLGELAANCERFIGPRGRENGVTIRNAVPRDLPRIRADERRLRQIFLNLLSNAVKFTPAGGTVTIEAALNQEGALELAVRDTGIGMRPEDIPLALEVFRQVDGALNRRFEGTGLGLPLVRTLAALHGGALRIESAPGAGTRAIVTLPAERIVAVAPPLRASGF
jgi:PAS domain S-box-containing protein